MGRSKLSQSTYFSPLALASTPVLGGEADEFEGLGPNTRFPGDPSPTYQTWYNSPLQSNVPLSNHWSLIGGYEATFIHGVALAPDQNLTRNGTAYSINTNGDVTIHGANAGLLFAYQAEPGKVNLPGRHPTSVSNYVAKAESASSVMTISAVA